MEAASPAYSAVRRDVCSASQVCARHVCSNVCEVCTAVKSVMCVVWPSRGVHCVSRCPQCEPVRCAFVMSAVMCVRCALLLRQTCRHVCTAVRSVAMCASRASEVYVWD